MTTKPHPTDAMEMPYYGDDFPSNWCIRIAGILRAERIKAYDLGRKEALEEQKPMEWAGKYIDSEGEHDVYVTTGEKP